MSLIQPLSRYFSGATRRRGDNYALSRRVEILEGSESSVEAEVAGSQAYFVSLELNEDTVFADCDCPYSEGGEACKHIWATLVVAEKQGYLSAARGLSQVSFALNALDDLDHDFTEETEDPRLVFKQTVPATQSRGAATGAQPKLVAKPPQWKKVFSQLRQLTPAQTGNAQGPWPATRQILYIIDIQSSTTGTGADLVLEIASREPKKNGDWGKPRGLQLAIRQVPHLPDPSDIDILARIVGARDISYYGYGYSYGSQQVASRYQMPRVVSELLMPLVCGTGRCFYRLTRNMDLSLPLIWDSGLGWELRLKVDENASRKSFLVTGHLQRGEQKLALNEPVLIHPSGIVIAHGWVSSLRSDQPLEWIPALQAEPEIQVPKDQAEDLLEEFSRLHRLPHLDLPPELRVEEVRVTPQFRLEITKPKTSSWQRREEFLVADLQLDYDGSTVPWGSQERGILRKAERQLLVRDMAAEEAAAHLLRSLKFRKPGAYSYYAAAGQKDFELLPKHLPAAVAALTAAGWRVEVQGQLYRMPGQVQIEVRSGIDWFELHGRVDFDGPTAGLPELLQALKRGERMVRLGDNSYGMLPEEWLRKYGLLASLGQAEKDHLRFSSGQAGLLDVLLAEQPEATCDAVFEEIRRQLRSFEGVQPSEPADGFCGNLRAYQKEGLGWLHFLRRFRFGGCLADDMGLGKTVQVLALLESRRAARPAGAVPADGNPAHQPAADSALPLPPDSEFPDKPSLVVMPRSLIFNWKQEAVRFAPNLRLLEHTGGERLRPGSHFGDYDVILTTYGTLRRDAAHLQKQQFDYVILDEAQAVKNARTESAKAVRLLRGQHRLALSGTPVENHLGELWSLFEFLNPGMLGAASVFGLADNSTKNLDEENRRLLARALRPFILRRTKEQVAKDLPPKLEQTLYCELKPEQRRQYNDLKEHYRQTLLGRIETEGLQKAKIHVLEALLRLRQAACHPGLIDKKRTADPSAKLDMLLPQIAEVLEEGHKALVFSQFTSLLAIVRDRLDAEKIPYLYLDGKTRDRGGLVEKFQNDPESRLFLVSLKAGGLGLNLTAAEYVFLLDPWWNPAVEAQAIDRTHRIGQTRQVFAYRLIARDTVEEKVLQLQESKRNLAEAIIREDNSLIRDLSREDLELLLG
ncbi:MAG: DEAD/DEAH box helicase [Acidobacteria bacterium]|nr:DEAD/DEAH box helicase [Acidobacteriota bacterium]